MTYRMLIQQCLVMKASPRIQKLHSPQNWMPQMVFSWNPKEEGSNPMKE